MKIPRGLAIVSLTILSACASPQRRASLLARARAFEQEGHYQASARTFEVALTLQPRDAQALQELGSVYDQLNEPHEAADRYAKALQLSPADYALHIRLAEVLARMGELERARQEFDAAKKLNRRQADAYVREGYTDLRVGDIDKANDDFSTAVAIDTGNAAAYVHLGNFYFWSKRDFARAGKMYQKAVTLLKADSYAPRAQLFWAMGGVATVRQSQGRPREAEKILRSVLAKATQIDDRVSTLQRLGEVSTQQRCWRKAEDYYKQAIAECEGSPVCSRADKVHLWAGSWTELARFYADSRDPAGAKKAANRAWLAYDESSGVIPNLIENMRILMRIGAVYRGIADDSAAERVYRRVLSLRDSIAQGSTLIEADAILADICMRSGRKAEAAKLLLDASVVARGRGEAAEAADLARRSHQALPPGKGQ